MLKKVSVIIPTFNCEKYINRCIESILQQTYKNIEIIIVNDGSTDNTINICNKFKKNNDNILLINKENEGPSIARKLGVENAKGEYISFIDSDDYIDINFYEKLINMLEHTSSDIAECGYRFVDENKKIIKESQIKYEIIEGENNCINNYIRQKNTTNYLCNKLFKKELFKGVKFQPLYSGEDACVLLQLFNNAKKTVTISDNLYNYVQTEESLCRRPYNLKKNDSISAGIFMYDFCKDNCPENCEYYSLYICSYAAQCYANLKYSNIDDKNEHMQYMKEVFYKYYDKNNSKFGEVSNFRKWIVKLFKTSPTFTSYIYKKVLKK